LNRSTLISLEADGKRTVRNPKTDKEKAAAITQQLIDSSFASSSVIS
jgi:hypothetical protein